MFLLLLIFEYQLVTKVRFSVENKSRKTKTLFIKFYIVFLYMVLIYMVFIYKI